MAIIKRFYPHWGHHVTGRREVLKFIKLEDIVHCEQAG
ncbi:hypothetical protein DOT_4218 [Desulfosporosinus sp. OT]|nr:hypothetical protein DOT_4218 [Desulfosporosinus sp. OT]